MIAWMVYSLIVGLCVCVAAAAADWLCRVRRWPVRFRVDRGGSALRRSLGDGAFA
jgi:hypothetical protein